MAIENQVMKANGAGRDHKESKWVTAVLPLLRTAAVFAASTAALTMGRNKQSISKAVAIVGTTTLRQSFTADFRQTPVFVFFVIANAIAGFYNLVVLIIVRFLKRKAFVHVGMHVMDLVIFALVGTAAAAAASLAELGKNGNMNARWSPICGQFSRFCMCGGLAIIASFAGAILMLLLNAISVIDLYNRASERVD